MNAQPAALHTSDSIPIGQLIDSRPVSGLQKRVVALCSLAAFLDGYDVQALGLAIPRMAAEFGVAPPAFAAAASGSLVGMALGAMLLSPLADRFGRRPMLIGMLLLMAVTTCGAAFATGTVDLAVWRVCCGLALGATVPIAIAITSEYAPARRRAALVTLMASCTAIGAFSGGLIAPWLDSNWGWRAIFGFGAVLPFAAAVLCYFALPESLRILLARRAGTREIAKQIRHIAPDFDATKLAPDARNVTQGASLKALFTPALRQRTTLLWVLFWINLFVNYSLISWLPTLLTQAGWDHASASRASGVIALGGIVGSLVISSLADRGKTLPALISGYLLATVVLALFVVAPEGKATWVVLLALVGIGAFGSQIALGSLTATYYPSEVRSTGVGWSSGVGRVGSFIGPLVLARLMTAGVTPSAIIGLLMVPMLICVFCVTLLPRALRTTQSTQT